MAEEAPQSQRIPEDEYQRGQRTGQFLQQASEAEEQINHMATSVAYLRQGEQGVSVNRTDGLSGGYHSGEWPHSRASRITGELSRVPGSGIDVDAMNKVDKLRDEAERVNKAHDVVTSEGRDAKLVYDEERIQRKLKGNNQIGPSSFGFGEESQELGAMAQGAGRKYDIKNGVAVRKRTSEKVDRRGNFGLTDSSFDEKYVPFPDDQQKAAKGAIKSLGEKQMRGANEQERAEEVRAAKELLGRAGVKIPKPKEVEPIKSDETKAA